MQKLMYSVDEGVEITGLKRTKLYELMLSGQLRSLKVGRRRLISAQALKEFVDELDERKYKL